MAQFDYLWQGGPEFAQSEHFRFGTDSVLLGNFVNLAHAKRAVDLGCASGVISLLMLTREPALRVTGVEIHREAAALAEKNIRHNNLQERCNILCGDLRNCRQILKAESGSPKGRLFVIVPEQFTVQTQRDMVAPLGRTSPINPEAN